MYEIVSNEMLNELVSSIEKTVNQAKENWQVL